jgi:hypothetical protein
MRHPDERHESLPFQQSPRELLLLGNGWATGGASGARLGEAVIRFPASASGR